MNHIDQTNNPNSNFDCPIYSLMKLISAKWTVEIMREISIKPTRTRQFLQRVPGLSMKSLQERIKDLEAYGMLKRVKYDEKVPKVEHHITERGEKLLQLMLSIKELAEEITPNNCNCPIEAYVKQTNMKECHCPNSRE